MRHFSPDDIRHIAQLARLSVSVDDLKKFPEQLTNILRFVSTLQKIDTNGIAPTHHVTEGLTELRDDVVEPSPMNVEGGIRVPSVFDQ